MTIDKDLAHPVRPAPHTVDAAYRWMVRSLRATSASLAAAMESRR